jgi:hypothetical protein
VAGNPRGGVTYVIAALRASRECVAEVRMWIPDAGVSGEDGPSCDYDENQDECLEERQGLCEMIRHFDGSIQEGTSDR